METLTFPFDNLFDWTKEIETRNKMSSSSNMGV
jgi:hypothetical protein